MVIPKEIAFELSEYRRRWHTVKSNMETAGVDVLATFGPHNVTYLTGMDSENLFDYQCAILALDAESPTLVVSDFELARSENSAVVNDVQSYRAFDDPVQFTVQHLAALPGVQRVALDRSTLTADQHEALAAGLRDFRLVEAFGLVEDARLTKSPRELELMSLASELTDVGVNAGMNAISEGVEDREVAAAIVSAMYRAGSDTLCWGPVVAAGYRAGCAHSTFNGHRIAAGETVFLELTGEVSRYVSPLMRTAVVGEPSPDLLRVEGAVVAALSAIVDSAQAGVPARLVAENGLAALEDILPEHIFHHYFGYPVGIGYPPTWIESLGYFIRTDNERLLETGMTFHLPISIRKYGEYGVNLSQTIVIEEDSARVLGQMPARLVFR